MDKKHLTVFTISFGILILLVVLLFARNTVRGDRHIQLPDANIPSQHDQIGTEDGDSQLSMLEIRPDTVQLAIEAMSRPAAYTLHVAVETFWSSGSGLTESTVYVRDDAYRVDTQMPDNGVRHFLTADGLSYIWYDEEKTAAPVETGAFSQDAELRIPTYEDILQMDPKQILAAGYGNYEGSYCIHVTTGDADNTTEYWIGTETGLLIGCERYEHGEIFYRMTSLPPTLGQLNDSLFQPPGADTAE